MNYKEEYEKLQAELERFKAENTQLKKELKRNYHGRKTRAFEVDYDKLIKLFGYKNVNGKLERTDDDYSIRCNYTTFMTNVVRAVMPYPRYSSKGTLITNVPMKYMTDEEYNLMDEFVNEAIDRCIEVKNKIDALKEDSKEDSNG